MKKKQHNGASSAPLGLRLFRWTVLVAVALVGVAGLFAAGSPQQERARRLDDQRVNDLEQISYAIDQFYKTNGVLPDSLDTLQNSRNIYIRAVTDPETGIMYEYLIEDTDRYVLCADFTTVSETDARPDRARGNVFWSHGIGRTCFELEVVPDETNLKIAPVRIVE